MAKDGANPVARKPRADAERNRALLLAAAKTAFAAKGPGASLDEIARAAGVGAGTLYRHFPTRDALVEALYLNETGHLADAAQRLAASHPPVEALREWMRVFVGYIATKRAMAEVLNALADGPSALYAASTAQIYTSITQLTDRAVASGEIRLDLAPIDLLRALSAVASTGAGEAAAKQLVDVLIAGLRTGA